MKSRGGFTILEILIATMLLFFAVFAAVRFMSQLGKASQRTFQSQSIQMDLLGLSKRVAKEFSERKVDLTLGVNTGYKLTSSAAFGGAANPVCPNLSTAVCQDLTITQTNPKYGTDRTLQYRTVCVNTKTRVSSESAVLPLNPTCSGNKVPVIQVSWTETAPAPAATNPLITLPEMDGLAGIFCARLLDDCAGTQTIVVDIAFQFLGSGADSLGRANLDVMTNRVILSPADTSTDAPPSPLF